jgi:anti-sigma-K factor RskA
LTLVVALAVSRRYEDRLHDLVRETATLRDDLARQQAVLAILTDPATRIVALAGQPPSPGARARVLWHEQAGGILVAAGLPALPPGKAYQLWALVGRRPPVPAGAFGVDARGAASLRVAPLVDRGPVQGFAVTLEPAGGLPAPSGPVYLAGRA